MTLVGGSPLWQRGVASLLEEAGHHTTVGSDLRSWLPGSDGSCLLVKLDTHEELSAVGAFREAHPHVPLIVVLDEVDVVGVGRAMRAGASTVTGEDEAPDVVLSVVGAALDDLAALPVRIVQAMSRQIPDEADISAWLSDEEAGWLRAMAAGQTVADIAEEVGYSERAMFRQLKTLYMRLGVRNRTEALLWAGRQGLLEPRTAD